jgi:hypothetical protein
MENKTKNGIWELPWLEIHNICLAYFHIFLVDSLVEWSEIVGIEMTWENSANKVSN